MAEYTYKDVIIDPEDSRIEIGAEYYFSDSPSLCIRNANEKLQCLKLQSVDAGEKYPFVMEDYGGCDCLIRKKEPSYAERQARWLAENCIKKGDKVRVVRQADSNEDGWSNTWNPDMDEAVGKVGTVSGIPAVPGDSSIDVDVPDVGGFRYPYFVLEKVEPKYVPFDLSKEEDRAKLRGAWIKYKFASGYEYQITAVETDRLFVYGEEHSPSSLLEKCLFLDGSPCGKLEVEE